MEQNQFDKTFYELTKRSRMRRKLDHLLRAYSLMGILIAILSGGYFLLSLLPDLSASQRMSLIVAGVGVSLAFMSRSLIIIHKERESEEVEKVREYESVASFLETWSRFERISKEVLSREGESFNKHSLRSVISSLYDDNKLDKADIVALEEALHTRNSIVHGERLFSTKIAEKITDSLVEIIKKIAT